MWCLATALTIGVCTMNKNISCLSKQQRGGMLVELMMTLAIAAIMIPFLFRYQQNTVERARNIAVTKQMEIVQNALEKYIVKNRASYVSAVGVNNWTVNLNQLNDFLPDGFSDPNGPGTNYGTYSLRVLKTQGLDNHAVLQGVVLLSNEDTPLRTREIVNLGGGKIGYIDGTNVRGGFNVFVRPKTDMGLTNVDSGLVGSTKTLRGNTEYLWRLPSGSESDATMQSPLNLDGHDIVNVNDASAMRAVFNAELNASSILVRNMMYFLDGPTFNLNSFVFSSDDAVVNGLLTSNSKLNVENILYINGSQYSRFYGLIVNGVLNTNKILNIQNLTMGSSDKPTQLTFHNNFATSQMDVEIGRMIQIRGDGGTDNSAGITPRLYIKNKIEPSPQDTGNMHYWDANAKKVFLLNVALTNLPKGLNAVYSRMHRMAGEKPNLVNDTLSNPEPDILGSDARFKLYSDKFLFGDGYKVGEATPFINVLGINLCKIKTVIEIKFNCLETGKWDRPNCKHVLNDDYPDSVFSHCNPGDPGQYSNFDTVDPVFVSATCRPDGASGRGDDDGNNNPDDETEKEKIKEENRQETGRGH